MKHNDLGLNKLNELARGVMYLGTSVNGIIKLLHRLLTVRKCRISSKTFESKCKMIDVSAQNYFSAAAPPGRNHAG